MIQTTAKTTAPFLAINNQNTYVKNTFTSELVFVAQLPDIVGQF
jgi:hypothetical protein